MFHPALFIFLLPKWAYCDCIARKIKGKKLKKYLFGSLRLAATMPISRRNRTIPDAGFVIPIAEPSPENYRNLG